MPPAPTVTLPQPCLYQENAIDLQLLPPTPPLRLRPSRRWELLCAVQARCRLALLEMPPALTVTLPQPCLYQENAIDLQLLPL